MFSTRLEGIAADVLREADYEEGPIDATVLAHCCGFEVFLSDTPEAVLLGDGIYIPRRMRISRKHFQIAHELGHWAIARVRQPDSEQDADYLGGAMLVPWRTITRELRAGWNLTDLRARHPHASAEVIAYRVTQVREAAAAIYDGGRLRKHIGDRDIMPANEREIVDEVLATGEAVRLDDLTGGWPVFDGAYRRVIVLASAAA